MMNRLKDKVLDVCMVVVVACATIFVIVLMMETTYALV